VRGPHSGGGATIIEETGGARKKKDEAATSAQKVSGWKGGSATSKGGGFGNRRGWESELSVYPKKEGVYVSKNRSSGAAVDLGEKR